MDFDICDCSLENALSRDRHAPDIGFCEHVRPLANAPAMATCDRWGGRGAGSFAAQRLRITGFGVAMGDPTVMSVWTPWGRRHNAS